MSTGKRVVRGPQHREQLKRKDGSERGFRGYRNRDVMRAPSLGALSVMQRMSDVPRLFQALPESSPSVDAGEIALDRVPASWSFVSGWVAYV